MHPHNPRLTRLQSRLLFVAALLGLTLTALPSLGLRHPQEDVSVSENRLLAPFPRLETLADWQGFPQAFEAYFTDRFKYRQVLTNAHHRLMIKLFHRSPTRKVVIADNGWLFYTGEKSEANAIEIYHRNTKPLTEQEVATMHEEMRKRRDWVASWGGKTLFVLVPNKETIYPEHLPPPLQQPTTPTSRFDQWEGIFAKDHSLSHVDLRPALRSAKENGLIYYRSDSHWNQEGAYVGYRETVNAMHQWFPEIKPVEKPIGNGPKAYRGDLAQMITSDDRFDEPDQTPYSIPRKQCAKPAAATSGGLPIPKKSEPFVFECDRPELPSAVIVRDSMANGWASLLPNNFRRTVAMFNWSPDAATIEREKPDVVIFETVERSMDQFMSVKLNIDPNTGLAHFD